MYHYAGRAAQWGAALPGPPPSLLTERGQHVVQVLLVNEAISVLVDHVEGLLKLLDLGLVKHGEDIGCGPLWPLLGGFGLGPLTGHLGFRRVDFPAERGCGGEKPMTRSQGTFLPTPHQLSVPGPGIQGLPQAWGSCHPAHRKSRQEWAV